VWTFDDLRVEIAGTDEQGGRTDKPVTFRRYSRQEKSSLKVVWIAWETKQWRASIDKQVVAAAEDFLEKQTARARAYSA
jgi:hypothetical protein